MRTAVVLALALLAGCRGESEDNAMRETGAKALPASCVEYRKVLDKLPTCEAMSKQELAALMHAYQDAATSWLNRDMSRMPASTLRAIDTVCTKGRDYVRERIAAQCPERAERDEVQPLPLPECNEYRSLVYKLASCEKLPQESRDALRQGFEAMERSWQDASALPAEARRALADACHQAADALKRAVSATCGD
jgi:hypothetical protein